MGFDEQMIQRLFGPASANAAGTAATLSAALGSAPGATTPTLGGLVAGMGQPSSFTVSVEAAKAMAGLSAASATSATPGLPTVGDLQNLGAQSIHIAEMADAQLAAAPQAPRVRSSVLAGLALAGLTLSGAPAMALLFGLGASLIDGTGRKDGAANWRHRGWAWSLLAMTALSALLALALDLWQWHIDVQQWGQAVRDKSLSGMLRLFVWFMWPAWPLALWTLWQWRRQLSSRHVALPLWFIAVVMASTLLTTASDRGLLLALPALAALAAFALPTLKRSVSALIDWFTLLFFSVCGITIWVIWIALQTGVPRQPAANVARLAPGFEHSFSLPALCIALLASLAWAWLVRWRTGRHRSALWKSLVLPAGGATLCWLLLMSLWLPLLDHARSYQPMVRQVLQKVSPQHCIETLGLSVAQRGALRHHGGLDLREARRQAQCPALLVDRLAQARVAQEIDASAWTLVGAARRPTEKADDLLIYRRSAAPQASGKVGE
jgi:hypothetical protein